MLLKHDLAVAEKFIRVRAKNMRTYLMVQGNDSSKWDVEVEHTALTALIFLFFARNIKYGGGFFFIYISLKLYH